VGISPAKYYNYVMGTNKSVKTYLRKIPFAEKSFRKSKDILQKTRKKTRVISHLQRLQKSVRFNDYVLNHQLNKDHFVDITSTPYPGDTGKTLIAYYLPQYYRIPQNDSWFGAGFTEWSNAAKACPQYIGHWQPHLPIDVGFYNLETTHAMHRQIELAKMYGIGGFCFYYYWFTGGDKIMEKPVLKYLNDKDLDFPFMFFWANEDWTNTWGATADMGTKTYSAKMKPADVKKFVGDIVPFLQDKRYITIEGRPHIIIYQPKKDPYLPEFIKKIGTELAKYKVEKPYISFVFPDDFDESFDPNTYGGDAAVEFGSHLRTMPEEIPSNLTYKKLFNTRARLKEYDMKDYILNKKFIYSASYPVHKGVMTHFDNTARKIYAGAQLFEISPELYKAWLTDSLKDSKTDHVFITAWNEWAEGMHLEPDQKYGYAYLQATKEALEDFKKSK
jgi:hypothetical protein